MEVKGYSERGILNSLFYEIKYSTNALGLLGEFLSLAWFPRRKINFQISEAEVLIEQSFSDFGDADAVLLINNQGKRQAIFIEAKVKAFRGYFDISRELDNFEKKKNVISNLLVQLFFKSSLSKHLQEGNVKALEEGVQFPEPLSKMDRKTGEKCLKRKIGNSEVVKRAVYKLKEYCGEVMFIALVPDDKKTLENFQEKMNNYSPERSEGWKDFWKKGLKKWNNWWENLVKNLVYISWANVEEFCNKNSLKETLKNFEFNEGQIYQAKI